MIDAVRFLYRGRVRSVNDVPPALSVLHWLREHEHATGTKEGCNQGDCGACTVVIATLDGSDVSLSSANSCLLPLAALHEKALFTVEDLSQHAVQEAMVQSGGSQCGFCTPGFVMSLWNEAQRARQSGIAPQREEVADAISGNLCRCTGYRPIVDAGLSALAEAARADAADLDRASLARDLAALATDDTLHLTGPAGTYLAPTTEAGLLEALTAYPHARLISGGTDAMPALHLQRADSRDDLVLVSTLRVPSLRVTLSTDSELVFGATVPLEDAWRALAERLPHLHRMYRRFAGPAIRSVGTIGGNIANGSPIADLVPVLQALDAVVAITGATGTRHVGLTDFATGLRTNVMTTGEFISRIAIPTSAFAKDVRSHKVSRRFDDDISTVSATFAVTVANERIVDSRVVMGGLATTVRRAGHVEQTLDGRRWDREALAAAQDALALDFAPISDHRATADYRMRAARGLLHRWWLETSPLAPAGPTDVWSYS